MIHDIVLKAHREEKIARANTAAIVVEQLAAKQALPQEPGELTSPSTPHKQKKLIKTEGAIYDDGNVFVVGNPLENTKEIRCSKCGLPRRLHPPIVGAPQSDPTIQYCKRVPFIERPGYDIYGQPLIQGGRQNGAAKNARKPKEKDLLASSQGEPGSSFESPAPSPPKTEAVKRPPKLVLPDVRCKKCGRDVVVNRFANHLQKCLEIGGRASGRAAALKINGQANGSQGGSTPPVSRRGTPLPPEKKSPVKRDAAESDGDEEDWDVDSPKKKKVKKAITKKWKSGKVTVNGKAVSKGAVNDTKDKEMLPKKEKPIARTEPREVSESSQTLSSP